MLLSVTQLRADAYQVETQIPTTIRTQEVRCFYPRKNGEVGSRITFKDGGGFAVADTFDVLRSQIADIKLVELHQPMDPMDQPQVVDHAEEDHSDNDGEDALPAPEPSNGTALAVIPAPATSFPTMINVDTVRCFYARREQSGPGTRMTFTDGKGFIVAESYEEVVSKMNSRLRSHRRISSEASAPAESN